MAQLPAEGAQHGFYTRAGGKGLFRPQLADGGHPGAHGSCIFLLSVPGTNVITIKEEG